MEIHMNIINVGVGDLAASIFPNILKTLLGSCVGVALYSPSDKVGGLIHIMLPKLTNGDMNRAKYANTGIPLLLSTLENGYGVDRSNLIAKIAGGANMFSFKKTAAPVFDIGTNNIAAVRYCLNHLEIPIVEEDVGANYGRRIEFYLESGKISIFGHNKQEVHI